MLCKIAIQFQSFTVAIQFPPHYLLERLFLPHCVFLSCKLIDPIYVALFVDSLFISFDLCAIFL